MQSKSPNILNLNSYAYDDNVRLGTPYQSNQQNQIDSMAIDEQFNNFVHQIQQYDQILSKIAKNVQQASHSDYFITDFYPEHILNNRYENDQQKKMVASTDQEMSKILYSLQKNNTKLKQQLKGWMFQFAKKTRFTEILLSQNKLLRKYVSAKNKQIVKLVQGITQAQNGDLNQLKCNLGQLQEENGILTEHLKQIKLDIRDKKNHEKNLTKAISEANNKKIQLQSKIQQNEDKQEHTAKSATMLQQFQKQTQQRQRHLTNQRSRLLKQIQQYGQDKQQIEQELLRCKIDRKQLENILQGKHKNKLTEKTQSLQQIQNWTEQYDRLNNIYRNGQQEILRNQTRLEEYTKINTQLDRKISYQLQVLREKQKQMNTSIDTETTLLSDIDLLDLQINKIKMAVSNKNIQQQQHKIKLEKQLKQFVNLRADQIARWNNQLMANRKQSSNRSGQERNDLQIKKKQIINLEHLITQRTQEFNAISAQINQIKQRQAIAAQMKQRLNNAYQINQFNHIRR